MKTKMNMDARSDFFYHSYTESYSNTFFKCFLISIFLLTGCTPAPSMVVFGASFPDWLFCLCGGVAGMVAIHLLLRPLEKRAWLAPQLLTYPALTALVAMLIWLLIFPH